MPASSYLAGRMSESRGGGVSAGLRRGRSAMRPLRRRRVELTESVFTTVINKNYERKRMPISDAEAVVMQVLWARHPLGADEVIAVLAERSDWAEATVKTLLNRLLNKGAIRATRQGRRYLYSPVLEQIHWVAQQSEGLLDRLFGGRVAPLVAHFSERGKLSQADIVELKRLVSELDDEH